MVPKETQIKIINLVTKYVAFNLVKLLFHCTAPGRKLHNLVNHKVAHNFNCKAFSKRFAK